MFRKPHNSAGAVLVKYYSSIVIIIAHTCISAYKWITQYLLSVINGRIDACVHIQAPSSVDFIYLFVCLLVSGEAL